MPNPETYTNFTGVQSFPVDNAFAIKTVEGLPTGARHPLIDEESFIRTHNPGINDLFIVMLRYYQLTGDAGNTYVETGRLTHRILRLQAQERNKKFPQFPGRNAEAHAVIMTGSQSTLPVYVASGIGLAILTHERGLDAALKRYFGDLLSTEHYAAVADVCIAARTAKEITKLNEVFNF